MVECAKNGMLLADLNYIIFSNVQYSNSSLLNLKLVQRLFYEANNSIRFVCIVTNSYLKGESNALLNFLMCERCKSEYLIIIWTPTCSCITQEPFESGWEAVWRLYILPSLISMESQEMLYCQLNNNCDRF